MKNKEFWIQLLVSAIIGGGGTGILVAFKEQLPTSLYITFLYVIWIVAIVLLISVVFSDWLKLLHSWIKQRRQDRIRLKQAKDLRDKWFELYDLISKLIENHWQPTVEQESKYFTLHFWFLENRAKFLRIWHSFDYNRTNAAHESHFDSIGSLNYKVFRDNSRDQFSYFYEPQTVQMLCHILKSEPLDEVRYVITKLSELAIEFVQWANK